MTSYYKQLYDVNFFASNEYRASVESTSVQVGSRGPLWSEWKSDALSQDEAESLWASLRERKSTDDLLTGLARVLSSSDRTLMTLILCEAAYRERNREVFFTLARALWSSEFPDVSLKAKKLLAAWNALRKLASGTEKYRQPENFSYTNSIDQLVNEAVEFCNRNDNRTYSPSDVKVEIPVREAWNREKRDINNILDVEEFYKTTYSYVLELTAANYQVETLFNYQLVLSHLCKLGVTYLFDFGAGIGTFVLLANKMGINCIYADLDSKTQNYAKEHIKRYGGQAQFITLDYYEPQLPQGVDCIVCTEVMEHICDPHGLVNKIYNTLRPGGIFVVSESFDYVEDFCTHMPQHKGKGGQKFLDFLSQKGFTRLQLPFDIHPTVHVKVR
jgi:SAM-dependent methyltransferase